MKASANGILGAIGVVVIGLYAWLRFSGRCDESLAGFWCSALCYGLLMPLLFGPLNFGVRKGRVYTALVSVMMLMKITEYLVFIGVGVAPQPMTLFGWIAILVVEILMTWNIIGVLLGGPTAWPVWWPPESWRILSWAIFWSNPRAGRAWLKSGSGRKPRR